MVLLKASTTSYQIVADHLNSLHKAREAYIQAENSDRIRRALIGRIFNGTHQKFCVGDRVYYKRADGSWHGPGYVIAQNGCQVLVKTGSRTLIKVMYNSQKRYYQSKGRGPIEKKRRCFRCGSLRHWVKECPEKIHKIVRSKQDYNNSNHPPNRRRRIYYEEVDESESEDEQPTDESSRAIFFQSDVGNEVEDILLVGQTINQAVLDCGASQTVCGTEWYQCYLDSLGDEQLNQITESPSSTVFKFGVGSLKALKQASIPVTICGRNIFLSVQIVKTDIPLLLSLSSMKKLGMNLDLPNDRVIIKDSSKNKKVFKLNVSTTGHYVIPIMEQNPTSDIETENETFKQILVAETSSWYNVKRPDETKLSINLKYRMEIKQICLRT